MRSIFIAFVMLLEFSSFASKGVSSKTPSAPPAEDSVPVARAVEDGCSPEGLAPVSVVFADLEKQVLKALSFCHKSALNTSTINNAIEHLPQVRPQIFSMSRVGLALRLANKHKCLNDTRSAILKFGELTHDLSIDDIETLLQNLPSADEDTLGCGSRNNFSEIQKRLVSIKDKKIRQELLAHKDLDSAIPFIDKLSDRDEQIEWYGKFIKQKGPVESLTEVSDLIQKMGNVSGKAKLVNPILNRLLTRSLSGADRAEVFRLARELEVHGYNEDAFILTPHKLLEKYLLDNPKLSEGELDDLEREALGHVHFAPGLKVAADQIKSRNQSRRDAEAQAERKKKQEQEAETARVARLAEEKEARALAAERKKKQEQEDETARVARLAEAEKTRALAREAEAKAKLVEMEHQERARKIAQEQAENVDKERPKVTALFDHEGPVPLKQVLKTIEELKYPENVRYLIQKYAAQKTVNKEDVLPFVEAVLSRWSPTDLNGCLNPIVPFLTKLDIATFKQVLKLYGHGLDKKCAAAVEDLFLKYCDEDLIRTYFELRDLREGLSTMSVVWDKNRWNVCLGRVAKIEGSVLIPKANHGGLVPHLFAQLGQHSTTMLRVGNLVISGGEWEGKGSVWLFSQAQEFCAELGGRLLTQDDGPTIIAALRRSGGYDNSKFYDGGGKVLRDESFIAVKEGRWVCFNIAQLDYFEAPNKDSCNSKVQRCVFELH